MKKLSLKTCILLTKTAIVSTSLVFIFWCVMIAISLNSCAYVNCKVLSSANLSSGEICLKCERINQKLLTRKFVEDVK